MAEPTGPQWHGEGPCDEEQALRLAEAALDGEAQRRARALCAELDELQPRLVVLFGRAHETLLELIRASEAAFLERGYRVLNGLDTTMTYETLQLANRLLQAWSGEEGLQARIGRLANLAAGDDVVEVDPEWIEQVLLEEKGR